MDMSLCDAWAVAASGISMTGVILSTIRIVRLATSCLVQRAAWIVANTRFRKIRFDRRAQMPAFRWLSRAHANQPCRVHCDAVPTSTGVPASTNTHAR